MAYYQIAMSSILHRKDETLMLQSVTRPAGFCILIFNFAAPSWLHHINLNFLWSLWLAFRVLIPQLYWIPPTIMQTKQQDALCKIWDSHSTIAVESNLLGCDAVSLGEQFLRNISYQSPTDTGSQPTRPESKLYCITHVSVLIQWHRKLLTIITFNL